MNVVDTKDAESEEETASPEKSEEEAEGDNDLVEVQQRPLLAKVCVKEPSERADDPVRLYLREMGSWSSFRARARSPSPSASRPAARP